VYGQYCNATAKQCAYVQSKADCEAIEGCDPLHPVCTDCTAPTYTYCEPDAGCQGPLNRSACIANPHCDVNNTAGCDPTQCTVPHYYTCDTTSYQCRVTTGTGPKPPHQLVQRLEEL
jgi:hypothetical protein